MWESIKTFMGEQLQTNMLFQGGIALSVLGAIALFFKRWALLLWEMLLKRVVYSIDVPQESAREMYDALVMAFKDESDDLSNFKLIKPMSMDMYKMPIGRFLTWRGISPIYFVFSQEVVAAATIAANMYKHSITITGIFAKKKIQKILDDSLTEYARKTKPKSDSVNVYRMVPKDGIEYVCSTRPKPIHDIVMKNNDLDQTLALVDKWKLSEERYRTLGLPYKLGILLYGVPGTGKTSLAYSIAMHLGYKVVQCSLSNLHHTDSFTSNDCVYVFDDIDREVVDDKSDTMGITPDGPSERKGGTGVKLLLSLLDARLTASNIVVVMTCNNIHALDEAIFRPGRVDMVLEFGYPTKEMAERFMSGFYKTNIVLDRFIPGRSMSFYQTCCLRHMDSPESGRMEAMAEASNIRPAVIETRPVLHLEHATKAMAASI